MIPLSRIELDSFIDAVLAEDVGTGDVTSEAVVPAGAHLNAAMVARQDIIVAGIGIASEVFMRLDKDAKISPNAGDGGHLAAGETLMTISGNARALLTAERSALNIIQHLSGIATMTRKFVDAIEGTGSVLLDTRKTTPLLRTLEKYATQMGGAHNHRMGLYDAILIKDNHVALAGGITAAVESALDCGHDDLLVEVECDTINQMKEALEAHAGRILLDNMSLDDLREAVALAQGRIPLEASGGVTLDTIGAIAETGVDYISVGAITQSAPAVDIGLDYAGD